jgi:lytic murein transglycosylase
MRAMRNLPVLLTVALWALPMALAAQSAPPATPPQPPAVPLEALPASPQAAATAAAAPALAAPAPDALPTCLQGLQSRAQKSGITPERFRQFTANVQPDMAVVALLDNQPEFRTPIWDYLAALVDEERVSDGKAMLAKWRDTLTRVAQRYGVDAETVVAVWGVESNYGKSIGKRSLITSLATLSCFGRRQDFFRGEFISLLGLLDRGDLMPDQAVGSWAGAFGHTQFMPSTYQRLAVDFDGDGRRDLVGSVPDALASTANFLQRGGWKSGPGWGHEVRLPAGFDPSLAGRLKKRSTSAWSAMGVKRTNGQPLEGNRPAGVLLPAGAAGPAFLVHENFDAIYGYNAAESYALAIALLSDRLRGQPALATPWPTDDAGLSRAERREVQTLLAARGHAIGEIDGMLGAASRVAIQAEQQRLRWPADGRAGQKLLKALRTP